MPNKKLLEAAEIGCVRGLRAQLCRGADIETTRSSDGATPLIISAGKGWVEFVQTILECGADVGAKDNSGDTALTVAVRRGQSTAVSALLNQF